jgi:hypothetical protein
LSDPNPYTPPGDSGGYQYGPPSHPQAGSPGDAPGAPGGPPPGGGPYPTYQPAPGYHLGYPPDPAAPYGYDVHGRPLSSKTKIVAGILQLVVGFGAGRFYTGHYGMAIAMLLTCNGFIIWGIIDGIILLAKEGVTDSEGRVLRS